MEAALLASLPAALPSPNVACGRRVCSVWRVGLPPRLIAAACMCDYTGGGQRRERAGRAKKNWSRAPRPPHAPPAAHLAALAAEGHHGRHRAIRSALACRRLLAAELSRGGQRTGTVAAEQALRAPQNGLGRPSQPPPPPRHCPAQRRAPRRLSTLLPTSPEIRPLHCDTRLTNRQVAARRQDAAQPLGRPHGPMPHHALAAAPAAPHPPDGLCQCCRCLGRKGLARSSLLEACKA